ncbi:hypothetical protein [Sneathiella limimaris]|uniref:hypothetical protein n=1 Tax=Sneathiella limimaris TaxID=1964213 RepID=UPI00146E0AD1|nr:hypothetical protein [Sneathiella limimaris]
MANAPGPRASLYVPSIKNGPEDLREDLAKQLQKLGIAAFTGEPITNRYSVKGEVFLEQGKSYVTWKIFNPLDQEIGLATTQEIGSVATGPCLFDNDLEPIALKSASEIDVLLGGSGVNFDALKKPTLFIPIVEGAPGDGSESLAAAMQENIIALGLDVLPEPWHASYILKGKVSMTPAKKGSQVISILWQLERQNGEYVGKVEQRNRIRAGSLNGPWGPVAIAAAKGGASGIFKLLNEVEAAYFSRKSK